MMISAQRAIARSLESLSTPMDEQRRKTEIASLQNPVKRAGLTALNRLVAFKPQLLAHAVGIEYHPDLTLLTVTGNSKVYRDNAGEVLKVALRTESMTPKELQNTADRMRFENEAMSNFLGEFMIPQVIAVEDHPLRTDKKAIVTRQAFHDIKNPGLFRPWAKVVNQDNLQAMTVENPKTKEQLSRFVNLSLEMHDDQEYRLIFDSNGEGNIGVDVFDGGIITTDGQPSQADEELTRNFLLRQHISVLEALRDL